MNAHSPFANGAPSAPPISGVTGHAKSDVRSAGTRKHKAVPAPNTANKVQTPTVNPALRDKILALDDALPPKRYEFRDGTVGGKTDAIARLLQIDEHIVDAVISLDRQEARREVAGARVGMRYLQNLMAEAKAARSDIFDAELVAQAEAA